MPSIAILSGLAELKLIDTPSQIREKVMAALQSELRPIFKRAMKIVKPKFQEFIKEKLLQTSEYRSLISGILKKDFGLYDPLPKLNAIIDTWLSNIQVYSSATKSFLSIHVDMFQEDFGDVTQLAEARIVTEKGDVLPWLDWLLTFGDTSIIFNYHVIPKSGLGSFRSPKPSRSGYGIMIPKGSWRVPPEFAGTTQDNWVTRAFTHSQTRIYNILQTSIEESII